MSDTARHDAPQHDGGRHTVPLHEVEAHLVAAGVPRSHRHVQRLCKSGLFDAQLLPSSSGDEWFVAPDSIPKAIGDLLAMQQRRDRRGTTDHDMSDQVAPQKSHKINTDTARHDALQRGTSELENREEGSATEPATSRYVALLERDNEFLRDQVKNKDEQIADLSKRFGETQTLLGAMQRMLAPLLGQADPFSAAEKREVGEPPNT